jgi:hypothetical protein
VKFIKTTICSPSWFHQRHGSDETYDLSVYQNDGLYHSSLTNYLPHDIFDLLDEYFDDLGKAYREEIQELYGLGCRELPHFSIVDEKLTRLLQGHIQFDDPTFCYFCSENMIAGMEKAGVDHEALLDTYIRAINVITQGRPEDLNVSVHMCRGNFKVGWT